MVLKDFDSKQALIPTKIFFVSIYHLNHQIVPRIQDILKKCIKNLDLRYFREVYQ
jgi:hypothetical protein